MRSRLRDFIGTLRAKHILLAGCVLVFAVILLLVAMVALLPTLISTPQVQLRLKQYLTASLKQPVAWSKMTASWSDGVYLSDFALGDGPPPLLGASVGKLHLVPGFGKDSSGRLGVNLVLAVHNVQLRLAPGPKKPPPEKVPDPLTQIAEAVQKFQGLDWPLPVDVRATVEVMPMTVQYRDPASGRRLVMRDLAFRLAMPSLVTLPVETSLTGSVAVDHAEPERVRFSARITDLVTAQNRLRPASAQFSAKTELPGVTFDAGGGLNREGGLKASLRLALPELAALVVPLAPRALPSLSGQVALDLRADIDPAGDLKILLDLDGGRISVSKIPGKKGYAGPLDIRLHQKIVSNHKRQQVAFTDGSLASPGLISASWSATVDHPTERKRSVAIKMGPVRLDLSRAHRMAAPFLPKDSPVRELKGTAFVGNIAAHWQGPKNNGAVTIEGSGVEISQLRLRLAQGAFTGEGVTLLLDKGTVPLEALLPVQVSADLSWSGKRLELAGSKPVLAQGMKGTLHLMLDDLELGNKKPATMRVSAEASQTLDFELVKIGAEHALDNIHEQLHVKARSKGGGELEASLPELKVTVGALHTSHSGKKITLRPIAADFSAESVHLPAKGKGSPTVQRALCSVSAADALRLTAEAGISGLAGQMATTKGSATFDLTRLFPLAAPFLPAGFAASGQAAASWDLDAPLPVKSLPKEKNPLRLAKGALALLDRGELTLKLDDLDLRLPTAQGKYLVKGLSTTPRMRVVIPRLAGPLKLDGGVQFAGLSGLPGAAGKLPVQGGTLTMTGELSDWKELRLNEELRLTPLGLSQVGELTVSRIDALLEDQVTFSAATALKRLDATLFAHLDGNFSRQPVPVVPGLELDGNLSAGARIDLTAARELRLRGYAKSRDFGVRDGKGMAASGIKADLVVDRSYALAEKTGADWVPLSAALVRPAAHGTAGAGASDIAARIYEDLRGESSGPRKIRIRKASFKSGIVPLETTKLEADLLLEPEVIGLSFFQAEVGGGTVRARGVIDLSRELPVLSTSCSFSRLDPALLFPDAAGRGAADGELTGEFILSAPLVTEQRALLEGTRLSLNLRRFSSRILEKALFAIDPYERNEKLVAQRKSLRMADLKELRVTAVDGALDLTGEVLVKGVAVEIPRVERLRLSELPIRKELASVVTGITKSRPLLDLVRSDTIAIGPKGELSLKRRTHAE